MIPHLDWAQATSDPGAFDAALGQAVRGPGFFVLENHDVSPDLIDRVFADGDRLFALPEPQKAALSILNSPHNRGWVAPESEKLDPGADGADRKEAFNIGLDLAADDPRVRAGEPFRGVNLWPDLPGFRDTMLAYFDAALAQGVALHRHFARDLGLDPQHFDGAFTAPMATLRLLSYPGGGGEGMAAGSHTDYGAITLLLTDGVSGLQARLRGGGWIDVPAAQGAFVVNIGDCLMRWTNGLYASTPHRVVPPPGPRRSVAFFLDPNPDTVIAALPGTGTPRYPAITGAEYLRERLVATYGEALPQ